VLGDLLWVDVLRDPLRFRYRMIGTNVVQPPQMDMNGRFVDDHPDAEFRRQALSVYTQVATTGRPLSVRHDAVMGAPAAAPTLLPAAGRRRRHGRHGPRRIALSGGGAARDDRPGGRRLC
jgi:hypothetical protein